VGLLIAAVVGVIGGVLGGLIMLMITRAELKTELKRLREENATLPGIPEAIAAAKAEGHPACVGEAEGHPACVGEAEGHPAKLIRGALAHDELLPKK
jgi:hypothetical protein